MTTGRSAFLSPLRRRRFRLTAAVCNDDSGAKDEAPPENVRKSGGIRVTFVTPAAMVDRRTIVKSALALGAVQLASPFVLTARAADTVKLGFANPLSGTYAAYGKNEIVGCQLAIEQINAKGGILGRQAEVLVEDSTSGDAGTAGQKSRKLIEGDKVDFLLGNVNSALALAMAQVSNEKGI